MTVHVECDAQKLRSVPQCRRVASRSVLQRHSLGLDVKIAVLLARSERRHRQSSVDNGESSPVLEHLLAAVLYPYHLRRKDSEPHVARLNHSVGVCNRIIFLLRIRLHHGE